MPYVNCTIANVTGLGATLQAKAPIIRIPDSGIRTDGLIRRYLLDGTLTDRGSQSKNCTLITGTERYVYDTFFGRKVLALDGATHFNADYAGLPSGAAPWSLACWSLTNNNAGVSCGMGYSASSASASAYFYTGYTGYGVIENCNAVIGGSGTVYFDGGIRVTGTGWHHNAMVYNGEVLQLYVDGLLQTSGIIALALVTEGVYFRVGSMPNTGTSKFRGLLCDIRLYDRVLANGEVLEIARFAA